MQKYKIVALNYADNAYKKAQKLNTKTAYKEGKVDFVYSYTREDLPKDFIDKNKDILNEKKGDGYYLWKPYFIKKHMKV